MPTGQSEQGSPVSVSHPYPLTSYTHPHPPPLKFSWVTLGPIRLLAEAAQGRRLFGSPLSHPPHHGSLEEKAHLKTRS